MCRGTNWKITRWVAGTSGRCPAADEQGDVRRGNLVALEESEDAVLLARVDAVGAQGAPRPEEEFGGRERFGKAQGHEVFLVLQTGGDNEGHVELFAEDGVDEGHQGHLVKAHLDGVAGEVLAELFDDALGDGALDDDAGDLRYRQAALRLFLRWCRGISRRGGFGVFPGRAYGFGEGIDGEGAAGGGEGLPPPATRPKAAAVRRVPFGLPEATGARGCRRRSVPRLVEIHRVVNLVALYLNASRQCFTSMLQTLQTAIYAYAKRFSIHI